LLTADRRKQQRELLHLKIAIIKKLKSNKINCGVDKTHTLPERASRGLLHFVQGGWATGKLLIMIDRLQTQL
jgi:hypothetical protein